MIALTLLLFNVCSTNKSEAWVAVCVFDQVLWFCPQIWSGAIYRIKKKIGNISDFTRNTLQNVKSGLVIIVAPIEHTHTFFYLEKSYIQEMIKHKNCNQRFTLDCGTHVENNNVSAIMWHVKVLIYWFHGKSGTYKNRGRSTRRPEATCFCAPFSVCIFSKKCMCVYVVADLEVAIVRVCFGEACVCLRLCSYSSLFYV